MTTLAEQRAALEPCPADVSTWVCNQGAFFGTIRQLLDCACCGQHEIKKHSDPRHFRLEPALHYICDTCWEGFPE